MTIEFKPVNKDDVPELAAMAERIWFGYWPALIGEDQTHYMVEKFQSEEAIAKDMAENDYEYWFLIDEEGNSVGYTGGHNEPETNRFFISKIYLDASARGKGYASQTIRFYEDLCRNRGFEAMYLTVNKHNELGIRAYKGKGFETIDSVVNDIGNGFVMDDYIMQKNI